MQVQPGTIQLHGTYSTSLRSRPEWRALEPMLASKPHLQESDLEEYDFCLQFEPATRCLRVLLLSPSFLEPQHKQETISKLTEFSGRFDSDQHGYVVAMLLSEEPTRANEKIRLDGLMTLQTMVVEALPFSLPIIPIPEPCSLLVSVLGYMSNSYQLPPPIPTLNDSLALVPRTIHSRFIKLTERQANVLSDVASGLQILSSAIRDEAGQEIVEGYFGDVMGKEMIKYWQEDEQ